MDKRDKKLLWEIILNGATIKCEKMLDELTFGAYDPIVDGSGRGAALLWGAALLFRAIRCGCVFSWG